MRTLALALLLLLSPAAETRHGKSVRSAKDGVPTLVLRGTHRERGKAHGFLGAKEIVALVDAFVPVAAQRKGGGWDAALVPAARRFAWPPRFEEELAGMLEGIREALPSKDARLLKSAGREISADDLKVINCVSDLFGMGCSSFSAWGELTRDGKLLTGRNADYATFPIPLHGCVIAVEPAEEGLQPTLSAAFMGMIASGTTLNREGLFITLHDEGGLPRDASAVPVPRALSLQAAAETCRTIDEVAAALRKSPVAVGNNIHVSQASGAAAVLEWDGNRKEDGVTVRPVRADEFASGIVCTNHFRARAERNAGCGRYAKLAAGLKSGSKIDLAAAKRMLDSVAPNGASVTYLSIVAFPGERRVVVAFSPKQGVSATKGAWTEIRWDELLASR
jgi:hypothetical protein